MQCGVYRGVEVPPDYQGKGRHRFPGGSGAVAQRRPVGSLGYLTHPMCRQMGGVVSQRTGDQGETTHGFKF
jgi:hypothetical protein